MNQRCHTIWVHRHWNTKNGLHLTNGTERLCRKKMSCYNITRTHWFCNHTPIPCWTCQKTILRCWKRSWRSHLEVLKCSCAHWNDCDSGICIHIQVSEYSLCKLLFYVKEINQYFPHYIKNALQCNKQTQSTCVLKTRNKQSFLLNFTSACILPLPN